MEAAKHQRRLRNGEGTADKVEVGKLVVGRHRLRYTQVDASDDDDRLLAGLHIGLDRWLAVELNGEVDHVAAFKHTTWWRIGPSAGNIDSHRRSAPYNLILTHHPPRMEFLMHKRFDERLTQQCEGPLPVIFGMGVGRQSTAEHGIADALLHRRVVAQRIGHRDTEAVHLLGRIVEVELIEHAVLMIGSQLTVVLSPVLASLCHEPLQVGLIGNLLGAEQAVGLHPGFALPHIAVEGLKRTEIGEAWRGLFFTGKLVIIAVASHHPSVFINGNEVDALPFAERHLPVVVGRTGHDIVARELPSLAECGILHPHVLVVVGEAHLCQGVLHED